MLSHTDTLKKNFFSLESFLANRFVKTNNKKKMRKFLHA